MQDHDLKKVAEKLLAPIFAVRALEKPLDEIRRQNARGYVEELLTDPRGAGLTTQQAARRADLMDWLERRRAECAMFQQEQDFKVYFRSWPRWVRGRLEKFPWREGVFLDFDAQGFQLRVRTRGKEGQEVVEVVHPDSHQVATSLEREHLRLRARVASVEKRIEAAVVELKELRALQQELDIRLAADRARVSGLLAPKKGAP